MAKTGSNIYRRKDGRYEGRILIGRDLHKKSRYLYVYAKSLREVKEKMRCLRAQQKNPRRSGPLSMGRCAEEWLEGNRSCWKPTTYDAYLRLIERYILPILGGCPVREFSTAMLDSFCAQLEDRSRKKELTGSYRKYICSIACQIAEYASFSHQLDLAAVRLPSLKSVKTEMSLPSQEELDCLERYLLKNASDDTCLGILFAMYTGVRIGELCALRWEDIDLENAVVHIRRNLQRIRRPGESPAGPDSIRTMLSFQEPKSVKSLRPIPLASRLLKLLKQYCRPDELYLIPGKDFPWTDSRTIQYRFKAILQKCGCSNFHFHLLRHAFASRCLREGFDLKSLSEIMGHSSVQVTLNIYVHSTMQQKQDMINMIYDSPQEEGTS
ncbi:MAG: tyrosine-type recombinase/integrase [Eubacteriales bacterium]|nr:tyrosine-type recombinase/integrase [Eubacteriales bacterium]